MLIIGHRFRLSACMCVCVACTCVCVRACVRGCVCVCPFLVGGPSTLAPGLFGSLGLRASTLPQSSSGSLQGGPRGGPAWRLARHSNLSCSLTREKRKPFFGAWTFFSGKQPRKTKGERVVQLSQLCLTRPRHKELRGIWPIPAAI